jgi:hypothetical protein
MPSTQETYTVEALFAGKDEVVPKIYTRLLKSLRAAKPGPVVEDPKKTSIHLNAGPDGTAFAGVHPRKSAILLNIRSETPIKSKRIRKMEQVSRNRCHNELLLSAPEDVDAELTGWLGAAYRLSSK